MTWWNKSKPKEPEVIVVDEPGQVIPCADPQNVIVVVSDPPPDLASKPKDITGYCFGYVCSKKHVGETFDNVTVDGFKERRVCQTCGGVSKPATVKRTSEAQWENRSHPTPLDRSPDPYWCWSHYYNFSGYNAPQVRWTSRKFVHYLDAPRKKK